jgi:membrane-associated phospholipid phosphatase
MHGRARDRVAPSGRHHLDDCGCWCDAGRPLLSDFHLVARSSLSASIATVVCLAGAWFYEVNRPDPRPAGALGGTAELMAFTAVGAPLSYIGASLDDAADRALGARLVGAPNLDIHTALASVVSADLSQPDVADGGGGGTDARRTPQFPSLHTSLALILTVGMWPAPVLRWIGLAINAIMLLSIPIDGGHYFIDIPAGLAIAWASIVVAKRIAVWVHQPRVRTAEVEIGLVPEKQPLAFVYSLVEYARAHRVAAE